MKVRALLVVVALAVPVAAAPALAHLGHHALRPTATAVSATQGQPHLTVRARPSRSPLFRVLLSIVIAFATVALAITRHQRELVRLQSAPTVPIPIRRRGPPELLL